MNRETFTVDAALLQELGERLIGRAHIALAELIKNAYDADAIKCNIRFDGEGILIADDGHGMSDREFLDHWMRIGTTHKVEMVNSRLLNRVLTGSKGIGRLSAQFLASEMELWSTSVERPDQALYAIVDWKNITRGGDLEKFEVLWEMQDEVPNYPDGHRTGTRISLKGLKTEWNADALERLGREIWVLRSPFDTSSMPSGSRNREDFYLDVHAPGIEGARTAFDTMRSNLFDNWKARIRGKLYQGRQGGQASVTVDFKAGYPDDSEEAQSFSETLTLPVGRDKDGNGTFLDRAKFEILVFRPEGKQLKGIPVGDMREYLARFGNVSVYDTGFRLPYYGSGGDQTGQDWLNIALDQGRRLNVSELLPERLRTLNRYMQDLPAPGRLFGAVEIDTGHETAIAEAAEASPDEWLQIHSSRDRLQANSAFIQLRDLVRFSLDLYANRYRMLSLQGAEITRARGAIIAKIRSGAERLGAKAKPTMPADSLPGREASGDGSPPKSAADRRRSARSASRAACTIGDRGDDRLWP